ncbi:MAG: TIGR03545 family protein [Pirellulaceae bacterium]
MINWKYVLPRLLILAVVGLFLWKGLNPTLHWWIVATGQRVTGARVDLEGVEASLLSTSLRLRNVQIANPGADDTNLVQADELVLDLDTAALLGRRVVVREGRISGIEVGVGRANSGRLGPGDGGGLGLPAIDWNAAGDQAGQIGARWLSYAADTLGRQAAEESETVRLSRELMRRWPAEYNRLEARADALRRRVDELQQLVKTAQANPLRNLESIRRAADEVNAIEQEMRSLRDHVRGLQQQAGSDRDALLAAQQRDLSRIRTTLQLENLNGEALSQYLLGPENGERLAEVISWVRWARQYMPRDDEALEPVRLRGENVEFLGIRKTPAFLIESLVLDGRGRLGGELLQFKGTASGLTNDPVDYGKPAVVRLQTTGAAQVLLEAVLDRTGEVAHDRISLTCPEINQPGRVLGNPDELALTLESGKLYVAAIVETKGEFLAGRILVRQADVTLKPSLSPQFGGPQLAGRLQSALDEVDRVEVSLELAGTLQRPQWTLHSDLGPRLATAVRGVFQRELDARLEQLAAEIRQRTTNEVNQFEQLLLARQRAALEKLQIGDNEVAQLSRLVSTQVGLPDNFRQGDLKLDGLFRRR